MEDGQVLLDLGLAVVGLLAAPRPHGVVEQGGVGHRFCPGDTFRGLPVVLGRDVGLGRVAVEDTQLSGRAAQ